MATLAWKEWREQRWKIGFGSVVLCAFALIGLRTRVVDDQTILIGTCAMGVLLLPILAAAGLVPAEREEGTLRLLLALPIAPRKVLAAKTLLGGALCAVPLIAALIVSLLVAHGREVSVPATLAMFGGSIVTALLLFVWMLAFTTRSESEGRAAGLAVGVLIFWMIATFGLQQLITEYLRAAVETAGAGAAEVVPKRIEWIFAPSPFVFLFATAPLAIVAGAAIQIAMVAGLWTWAARSIEKAEAEGG